MKSLLIFVLCVTVAYARPQRFPIQQFPNQGFIGGGNNPFLPNNNNNNNVFFPGNTNSNNNNVNNGNIVTTTAAPAGTVTTASPQFLSCLQSCPSTMEYNPVCGTDMENYHNNGRLGCAQRCGKNVAALRIGTCNPL
ncbi:probable basic-leucine zipper transcription factor G [Calliphora vicina]|uniref:probable basic-leucine zipper transcription factor G n=1 Tax=Calliphora vicina TaxID=7373 RepID=UPI00325AC678